MLENTCIGPCLAEEIDANQKENQKEQSEDDKDEGNDLGDGGSPTRYSSETQCTGDDRNDNGGDKYFDQGPSFTFSSSAGGDYP